MAKNIWSNLYLSPDQPRDSWRPTMVGRNHAAASGHYLATEAAMRILDRGGNAVDAGVCATLALPVLQPNVVSFAGVAPTLIYLAEENRVVSLEGLGYWPAATDVDRLVAEGGDIVPEGLLRTVMPASPATHILALRRYGTMSFEEVATAALELARDGFAMYPLLAHNIEAVADGFDRYPENARILRPGGRTPAIGACFRQEDLGRTIAGMIEAERAARGDRDAKLRAVHDFFYKGPIAKAVARYHAEHGGFVTEADLAGFEVPEGPSIHVPYHDLEVHTCDVWCQGIVMLETLRMLEGVDLQRLGHNSLDYVHLVSESLSLAFADREAYVGDPRFVDVPTELLLSPAYAERQRARIRMDRAFGEMPAPGGPAPSPRRPMAAGPRAEVPPAQDTIYGCTIDRWGNGYSCTPSDNANDTPIIPGTGLAISSRGNQSRLVHGHPNEVKPGKRPRLTPSPAIALRDGQLYMVFGTPGGDMQKQAMLQVLLNVHQFGMDMQQAIEKPRFGNFSYPNSFAPHQYLPGRLCVEKSIADQFGDALRARGHDLQVWPERAPTAAGVCAIMKDVENGFVRAGADCRREGAAAAW
ncbi:MAG: gamma-glutamyltransferase family protein [bacterium]|nr:gamma-glutamyltransferase [Betaproteobacteria bacterium]